MERRRPTADMNQQIQLQQKIIHYRSEISNYKNKLKALETELKKETLRNQYLQKKLHHIQTENIEQYEKKIASLENQLLSYEVALEEEKTQLSELKKNLYLQKDNHHSQPIVKLQSFFNYSLLLPGTSEDELLIFGDFTMDNIGTEPLHEPMICIRIKPIHAGKLSGKITTQPLKTTGENFLLAEHSSTEWTFVHENWREIIKNNGEYWLKPLYHSTLEPSELLQFHNFEIQARKTDDKHALVIEGYVYCKEFPKGIPSLNNIIVNW
ncbi:hypothetical protein HNQ85_002439 [Anoxybacillus calidus]|jgi:hypothetical protein|uniref:Uncharacterized protein n=1 Tax=[Anoxybacillus] calidus TaxID=575178 RepID=A0A7V9Z157_9BACL|nr:hypothetical protein [Anoxybacillus calidus]MBA2872149.1 hypothetical protein [Anoxybacillus calidus]